MNHFSLTSLKEEIEKESYKKFKELLYNIKHIFITPLSNIVGIAEILESKEIDIDKKQDIRDILLSANDLLNEINKSIYILELEGTPIVNEKIELNKILSELNYEFNKKASEKKLRIYWTSSIDFPSFVNSDTKRLKTILGIFLDYAIKYTDNGYISFKSEWNSPAEVCIRGIAIFTITYSGPGLPSLYEGQKDQIFHIINLLKDLKGFTEFSTNLSNRECLKNKYESSFKIFIPFSID